MMCPHCGKETEQSLLISGPTKDIFLNLNAGCAQPYMQAVIMNVQGAAPPPVLSSGPSLNNACTGAGAMQYVSYVQF